MDSDADWHMFLEGIKFQHHLLLGFNEVSSFGGVINVLGLTLKDLNFLSDISFGGLALFLYLLMKLHSHYTCCVKFGSLDH